MRHAVSETGGGTERFEERSDIESEFWCGTESFLGVFTILLDSAGAYLWFMIMNA